MDVCVFKTKLKGLFMLNARKITPYKKGSYWYFKDYVHGERKTVSTGCNTREDALAFITEWTSEKKEEVGNLTMESALSAFTIAERNPKMIYCQTVGKCYSLRHSKHRAAHARDILSILNHYPSIQKEPIRKLTRSQCLTIFRRIVDVYGLTSRSESLVKAFKSFISWYYESGMMETNPSAGILNVKPSNKKKRESLDISDLKRILKMPEIWRTDEYYNFFRFIAYTGMRLSEAAAFDQSLQITRTEKGIFLTIDRAFKDDGWNIVGKPKWDLVRTIPLCDEAISILDLLPGKGLCFPGMSKEKVSKAFVRAREILACNTGWHRITAIEKITAHVLRHSLNTNLILAGCPKILVSEYLSWTHQHIDESPVQNEYTHIYAENLIPVKEKIDDIF